MGEYGFLSQEQIEELAARHVPIPKERTFPMQGEVFARLVRDVPSDRILKNEEGWMFAGYGQCLGYTVNEEAKPMGRSLWWWYWDLTTFPAQKVSFKLQPPQVVKGIFSLQGGAMQMKILWVREQETQIAPPPAPDGHGHSNDKVSPGKSGKILQFRPRKT